MTNEDKAAEVLAFQSLDWVERLSDPARPPRRIADASCFNPSTGLSVFQTPPRSLALRLSLAFQSLDWVERLSDPPRADPWLLCICVSIPRLG